MKTKITFLIALVMTTALVAFRNVRTEEEAKVKEVILNGYVNGAFNKLDAETMASTFHKDFAIYSPQGDEIRKYPIADWVANTKRKRADNYDPKDPKNVWKHEFASVDVTGHAAQVKVKLFNQGKHVFTDYLSLLRFGDDWKIVAKVYYRHE